jgi:hypothetical protein
MERKSFLAAQDISPQAAPTDKTQIVLYWVLVMLWCLAGYWYRENGEDGAPWFLVIGVFFFGIPIFVSGYYGDIVRKIEKANSFKSRGVLHYLATGRWFSLLKWLVISMLIGLSSAVWFAGLGRDEWLSIAIIAVSFFVFFLLARRLAGAEYKNFIATLESIRLARWSATALSMLVYFLLGLMSAQKGMDIGDRLAELGGVSATEGKSLLLQWALYGNDYFRAIREALIAGALGTNYLLQAVFVAVISASLFWGISATLSCFIIPRVELRRIFGSAEVNGVPAPVNAASASLFSALAVLVSMFVIVPSVLQAEAYARSSVKNFENCEGQVSLPGTCKALEDHDLLLLIDAKRREARLSHHAKLGFKKMRTNVNGYLDHYYTLPAEYGRAGSMLMGNLESSIRNDLQTYLKKGNPFREVDSILLKESIGVPKARLNHERRRKEILQENRVEHLPLFVQIDVFKPGEAYSQGIKINSQIDVRSRLGGGAVSGIVAFAVTKKLVAKGTVKLAASAIAKAAASKGAAVVGGAATGAIAGSIVPGAGTFVGSILGAGAGLVLGVSADKLMLVLEEAMNRDALYHQIMAAIDDEEARVLDLISVD